MTDAELEQYIGTVMRFEDYLYAGVGVLVKFGFNQTDGAPIWGLTNVTYNKMPGGIQPAVKGIGMRKEDIFPANDLKRSNLESFLGVEVTEEVKTIPLQGERLAIDWNEVDSLMEEYLAEFPPELPKYGLDDVIEGAEMIYKGEQDERL